MKKVNEILARHISAKDTVIVGVSGGPDSSVLLDIVYKFAQKNECKIVVAHVHHGVRGEDADLDAEFVKQLAEDRGLEFELKRAQLKGTGIELKGRMLRYEFFVELREKHGGKFVLTAHTAHDQAETILFNFIRGAGPTGLGGMKISDNGFLKPLLEVPKKDIFAYLKKHRLESRHDVTNDHLIFTRNFLRHQVIPQIETVNPAFTETVGRNAQIFHEFENWVRDEARRFLNKKLNFQLSDYERLPRALKLAVIQETYKTGGKTGYALSLKKVFEVEKLLARNVGNKRICLGGGGEFYLNKGVVSFCP